MLYAIHNYNNNNKDDYKDHGDNDNKDKSRCSVSSDDNDDDNADDDDDGDDSDNDGDVNALKNGTYLVKDDASMDASVTDLRKYGRMDGHTSLLGCDGWIKKTVSEGCVVWRSGIHLSTSI